VTKQATFQNCMKWMEELRQNAEPDIVVMLVGNKVDLVEKDPSARQVYYDAAAEFARQQNLFFSESSAVTSYNVKHIFEHLLQEIYNQQSRRGPSRSPEDNSSSVHLRPPTSSKNSEACDQQGC